jgi:phage tail tape-measure protein
VTSERGQATIEWTGLVLLATLVLAALAALVPRIDGRGLGGSVAHAITCAARGGCAARPPPPVAPRTKPRLVRPVRPARPVGRAAAASQALRGAGEVAKRVWIVCLGYRRYRYELEHPRAPTEAMPLEEALDVANECLNPLGFLAWD